MTAPVLAADAVAREELTYRARTWDGRSGTRYESLREWVSPALPRGHAGCTCGRCDVCLWAVFRWDLSLLDGLNDEWWAYPVDWAEVDDDEKSYAFLADPEGAAREDLEMRVAAGLDALTGGTR